MRLAIIRQRYTPYGGAERFVENALEALLERDVAITLYTRAWPDTRLKLIEPHIVDPFYVGRLWRDMGFARAVTREIGRAHLDLVQSHERLLACDLYRAGDGVHAVWLEERLRDAPWWKRLGSRLSPWHRHVLATERKLFASPWLQAVICNSTMVRDEISQRFGVAAHKLRVIYSAVDSNSFSPALREHRSAVRRRRGIPEDALVYLLVGSGYERKGVRAAIEALAGLSAGAWLLVVGRDKDLPRYRAFAAKLGLQERVVFTGPQADPRPYYGAADVFVLPTLYDPLPNAALEAMACGLPVVTSTKSGAAEIVTAHECGFVCPSRDVAALARHMAALADPALRERMGVNARTAVATLTPEAMTLQLVLLYKELLEASARQQKEDLARRLNAHRARFAGRHGAAAKSGTAATSPATANPSEASNSSSHASESDSPSPSNLPDASDLPNPSNPPTLSTPATASIPPDAPTSPVQSVSPSHATAVDADLRVAGTDPAKPGG